MNSTPPKPLSLVEALEETPSISVPPSCEAAITDQWTLLLSRVQRWEVDITKVGSGEKSFEEARDALALFQGLRRAQELNYEVNLAPSQRTVPARETLTAYETTCISLRPMLNPLTAEDDFL